ncbi:MAG: hypothetical protein LBR39_02490 [Coriobacteriales bacterium]|nr:hypothetical protein [Coriobacteriales bacterium]
MLTKNTQGSTLVWVLVVTLVLIIVFGVALMAVSSRFNTASLEHREQQAYYTALSSAQSISSWIAAGSLDGAANNDAANSLLSAVAKSYPNALEFSAADISFNTTSTATSTTKATGTTSATTPAPTPAPTTLPPAAATSTLGEVRLSIGYSATAGPSTEHPELRISATATYSGVERTVSVTMIQDASRKHPNFTCYVNPFNPLATDSTQQQKAATLNAFVPDTTPVEQGMFYNSPNYINTDDQDRAKLKGMSDSDETKWENFSINSTGKVYTDPDTLGPFSYDADNGIYLTSNYQEDVRSFTAPGQANGTLARMTFNPQRWVWHNSNAGSWGNSVIGYNDSNNSRLSAFSISNTTGKNVYMRLGGDIDGARNMKRYNAIIAFDFTDQQTGGNMLANQYVEYYPNNQVVPSTISRSGNTVSSVSLDLNGYPANSLVKNAWYPQRWLSATIYTQNSSNANINAGVDTRLMFYPYFHQYATAWERIEGGYMNSYFDYWGWGSYVNNPNYGQDRGDFYRVNPGFADAAAKSKRGMASIPSYFGENFDLYLLDDVGSTTADADADGIKDRYDSDYCGNLAWITQGVNILNKYNDAEEGASSGTTGSIYSTRGLTIGGMPIRSAAWKTSDGVNVDADISDAFIEDTDEPYYASAYNMQLRYNQIIYNTDIVLTTPAGASTPRESAFKPAVTYRDVYWYYSFDDAAYKVRRELLSDYKPQTAIIGGRVFVGAGQTLTIYGGKELKRNPGGTNSTSNEVSWNPREYTITVAPAWITVAKGAKLVIKASENYNVQTDIYVDGGVLEIQAGAKIKGNIYCYNGGQVVLGGDFALDAPDGQAAELCGIFIYGEPQTGDSHTAAGLLVLSGYPSISGTANGVHLMDAMNDWTEIDSRSNKIKHQGLVQINGFTNNGDIRAAASFLCDDHGEDTASSAASLLGACKHFGSSLGAWQIGAFDAD